MVKFSREYEASIIPEWKAVFVDYKCLKKLIKRIKIARRDAAPPLPLSRLDLMATTSPVPTCRAFETAPNAPSPIFLSFR